MVFQNLRRTSRLAASLCMTVFFLAALSTSQTLAAASASQSPVQSQQSQVLTLAIGQAHVLNEPQVKRIAVGNGKVMQATALDDRQILIIPEATGQSTLHLWTRQGLERVLLVQVVPSDANRVHAEVSGLIGQDPNLKARVVGDKVVLEGSPSSESSSARVAEIAKRYPTVVNLVSRTATERMIAIDVRMVEIRRDAMQNVGVKWSSNAQGPSFGIIGDLHRSDRFLPGGAAQGVQGADVRSYAAPFGVVAGLATSLTSMLNLMVQNGDAVILAEPRLSCRSGGEAKFIAGGELPIPVQTGLGQTSVSFKEYGVKFDIRPTANENNMISAKIGTEISALNFDVKVKDIPGLSKRRADTEVNLRENETLIIAGLVTDEMSRHVDKVPALGDVPILGKLFRSRNFRDQQSELVVMITPRFVSGEMNAMNESLARPPADARALRQPDNASTPVPSPAPVERMTTPERVKQRINSIREPLPLLD